MTAIAAMRSTIADIKQYRRVYWLAIVASFGGMLFGWVSAIMLHLMQN